MKKTWRSMAISTYDWQNCISLQKPITYWEWAELFSLHATICDGALAYARPSTAYLTAFIGAAREKSTIIVEGA